MRALWLAVLALSLAGAAYIHFRPDADYACLQGESWQAKARQPIYVLPHFQDMELADPKQLAQLAATLEEFEPGGAQGKVRMGYQMVIELYRYAKKENGQWRADAAMLQDKLRAAASLNRPFVAYIKSNHFQSFDIEYLKDALADERNLMHYRDGGAVKERYFITDLIPFTLSTDQSIPQVKLKFAALKEIAKALYAFDRAHPGLLQGISLNGETHYLFKDFYSGTGNYAAPPLTDYSPQAIKEFAAFLSQRGMTANAEAIKAIPFTRFETGYMPISGWLNAPASSRVAIYIDDTHAGDARRSLNRMDVYDAASPRVDDPNTGFQFDWDYASVPPGRHIVQAVVVEGEKRSLLGENVVVIGEGGQDYSHPRKMLERTLRQGSMDWPREEMALHYEPLARQWALFREGQVARHVTAMAQVFRDAGFGEEKIYSYQLAPWTIGSWNGLLFGVGEDFFRLPGMRPGMNLYGGNIVNPAIFDYMDASRGYAVTEFHPQMDRARDRAEETLRFHYCHGAAFLSPYFFGSRREKNAHDKMIISPENPAWSSDHFYHALHRFMKY